MRPGLDLWPSDSDNPPVNMLRRDWEILEPRLQADGVPYLIADPSEEGVLHEVGLERAAGLVCAVDSEGRSGLGPVSDPHSTKRGSHRTPSGEIPIHAPRGRSQGDERTTHHRIEAPLKGPAPWPQATL